MDNMNSLLRKKTSRFHPHPCIKSRSLILLVCSLLICFLIVEAFLRSFPQYIPLWYRSTLPIQGIELFYPGILEATPISGVPLPYNMSGKSEFRISAPQDLQALGLVSPEVNPDRENYPEVYFKKDRHGLPNPTERTRADVLLVGDSYALAAGVLYPLGFQARVQGQTGLTVFNLGIPSLGPQREEFLLDTIGLKLRPRSVIWLFFGGNDIDEAHRLEQFQQKGIRNYRQLFPDFTYPTSFLADMLSKAPRRFLRARPTDKERKPLPPFRFNTESQQRPLWFHPVYLRNLSHPPRYWKQHPGWPATQAVFRRTSRALRSQGIRMLLVYVPSKPQVYLSHVEKDAQLLREMASFDLEDPLGQGPEEFWETSLRNRGSLDRVLSQFAEREGIDYLSLVPVFNDAAGAGSLCYLSADTHWNEIGQAAAAKAIVVWLNSH